MGILSRLRGASAAPRRDGAEERLHLTAAVPLAGADAPLWQVDVQVVSEPQADGDKLRLRAHVQTNFGSALRAALTAAPRSDALPGPGARNLAQRTGALVTRTARRVLATPVVGRLAQPLLRMDFNTWVELQASTASLDAGSGSLLPQAERLAALGIRPRRAGDQPMAESWAGEGPNGFAQVSVLQMDKRHLPPRLAALVGDKPFQLAAAIVNTVEEK